MLRLRSHYRIPSSEVVNVADVQYDLRDDAGLAIASREKKSLFPLSVMKVVNY